MRQKSKEGKTLDFHLLRCLIALVDHAHISRAADAISMSQPTMSRALGQLRALIADPILVKGTAGLTPTTKALQLRELASRILEETRQLLGQATDFDPRVSHHHFRLVATDYVESVFMERLLVHLGAASPNVSVTIVDPVHPTQFSKLLEDGKIDFAFGLLADNASNLRHRPLLQDKAVCAARSAHWAVGKSLTYAEFADLDHVVIMPNAVNYLGADLDAQLATQGLKRNRRYVTPNYLSALHLLTGSDMVALLPARLLERFRTRLTTIPMPMEATPFEVCLSWHERTHHDPAHVWFREQVAASLASS